MANETTFAASQAIDGSPKSLRFLSKITWYELLAVPVVAVVAAIFLVKDAVTDAFLIAHERTALMTGAGLVPLGVWISLFLGTLLLKPGLLRRHYRLWIASVFLLALTFGILSLFRPMDGTLAWFTLGGYVSLGGIVGETIAGHVLWQQALRIGGLAIITVILAFPTAVIPAASAMSRLARHAYFSLALAAGSIGSLFQSKRRVEDEELGTSNTPPLPNYDANYGDSSIHNSPRVLETGFSGKTHYSEQRASPFTVTGNRFPATDYSAVHFGSHTLKIDDTTVPETQEREEAYMQANTDYDFWYSRTDMENELVDDENHKLILDPDPVNENQHGNYNTFDLINEAKVDENSEYDVSPDIVPENDEIDIDTSMPHRNGVADEVHKIDIVSNVNNQSEELEEKPKKSGLAIRLLGKNHREWRKPAIEMLDKVDDRGVPEDQILATAETIRQTLADYGIEVEIGSIKYGPTVTMYGIIPGWVRRFKQVKLEDEFGNPIRDQKGKQIVKRQEQKTRVKVDSILSREKDLSLALRTPNLRIETPVMGKAQVGIEIPNQESAPVTLRSIMESKEYQQLKPKADLPVALGKGTGGENIALDLATMPHLLIAGATGSGKSVALNAIVAGLLMERSPAELRLLLIDPKRVELTPYNGIPHLLCPVIVEVDQVVGMLKGVINEMMSRYRQMEEIGVRNIEAYNKRMRDDKMPFLMVVVDELADLMMTGAFDVEQSLCRLAQLGRATGIHLILATQRPSVDVVTGLIKANFPSRISFGVTSHIDSRTILDSNGAEKLLGKGDMLYLPRDAARPIRAQGAFISDKEIERLIDFWQTTPRAWIPDVKVRPVSDEESDESSAEAAPPKDALFDKAVELAYTQKKLSTSLLQRRLRIGYPRAARLMDELEDNGIVSASDGSRSRDVIISNTA